MISPSPSRLFLPFFLLHIFVSVSPTPLFTTSLLYCLLLATFFSSTLAADSTQCYTLLGTPLDDEYQPCSPNAVVASACCQTNKNTPDICLSSGLCYSTNTQYAGAIYGNGCTDSTGDSSQCPHFCDGKLDNTQSYNVLQCPEIGTWCCRVALDNTNCCSNASVTIRITDGEIGRPLPTYLTSTATASATSLPTGSAACPSTSSSLAALVALFWMYRRQKEMSLGVAPGYGHAVENHDSNAGAYPMQTTHRAEADGEAYSEMP